MGVHRACFFIARAGRAATPERNRSGNQPPILCILPLVAHQLASARQNWLRLPDRFLPWFVLSRNLSTISDISIWLRFGAFLSSPARSLRIHWPTILSPRTTPTPARRGQVACRLSPLTTACHRPGPDLNERPLLFSMAPNRAIPAHKILGTHRATHVSSCGRTWVAPFAVLQGPHSDLRLKDAD